MLNKKNISKLTNWAQLGDLALANEVVGPALRLWRAPDPSGLGPS